MKIVEINIDRDGVDAKMLDSIYVVNDGIADRHKVGFCPIGECSIDYVMRNKNTLKFIRIED